MSGAKMEKTHSRIIGRRGARFSKPTGENIVKTIDTRFKRLPWYAWWLKRNLRKTLQAHQLKDLLNPLREFNPEDDNSWNIHFFPVWDSTKHQIEASDPKSIDGITDKLVEAGLLDVSTGYSSYQAAKALVFVIVGWQTMLYSPNIPACLRGQYCIEDETDGYRGESHMSLEHSTYAGSQNLSDFLLGFGMMLPPPNFCAFTDADEKRAFKQIKSVTPSESNAHLLHNLCGVKLQWTDSLSCHMEFNQPLKVLYFYRYPSFYLANLPDVSPSDDLRSPLHGCASAQTQSQLGRWASERDVTNLLEEVLLSYQLLFGQTKRARIMFLKKAQPFVGIPVEGQDHLLHELCSSKSIPPKSRAREDHAEYDLAEDFPHLKGRIMRLLVFMAEKKPRSLREMWLDKRDSATWMIYWTVLIFGSVGLLLSFIQTVFQVLQYAEALKQGQG